MNKSPQASAVVPIAVQHQARFGIEYLSGKEAIPRKIRILLYSKICIEPRHSTEGIVSHSLLHHASRIGQRHDIPVWISKRIEAFLPTITQYQVVDITQAPDFHSCCMSWSCSFQFLPLSIEKRFRNGVPHRFANTLVQTIVGIGCNEHIRGISGFD